MAKGGKRIGAGRTKGSANKVTTALRERINSFLSDKWESIEHDFDLLEPKDRLHFFEKLLAYSLPKLQAVELESVTKQDVKPFRIQDLIAFYSTDEEVETTSLEEVAGS